MSATDKQLLAPNGKPSNLNSIQYALVRTPAFKKWFGDWINSPATASKVVDENGEPLVVYHGTTEEFYAFLGGAYFTDDYMNADGYALGEIVLDAFLNIKNPLIINARGRKWDNLKTKYGTSTRDIVSNLGKYDGAIFKNINDNWFDDKGQPQNVYYTTEPNQIKLADGSNTTFDASNPDIRFEEGGSVDSVMERVLSGEIDSDDGAIEIMNSGVDVTNELYDELREAEKKFRNKGRGLWVGDTVKVIGRNGNADFEGNYRGKMPDGKLVVWTKGGMQITVSQDEIIGSYSKGGSLFDADKKEIYKKWKQLINMSASELGKFYFSKDGKEAGLSPSEAKSHGIHSGRQSARWIMKMKKTPMAEWTPEMWEWANRQISFVSRMRGNAGALHDENGNRTRKLTSLLIWGHNPEKFEDGGGIENGNIVCENCGWSWKVEDAGEDKYVCHKCGHDNSHKHNHEKGGELENSKANDIRYEEGGGLDGALTLKKVAIDAENGSEEDGLRRKLLDIAKKSDLDISKMGSPRIALLENGKAIGGIFANWGTDEFHNKPSQEKLYSDYYVFDIAISRNKRNKGYSKLLIDAMIKDCIENFPNAKGIIAEVFNKKLYAYLMRRYNFSCDKEFKGEDNRMHLHFGEGVCILKIEDAKKGLNKFATGGEMKGGGDCMKAAYQVLTGGIKKFGIGGSLYSNTTHPFDIIYSQQPIILQQGIDAEIRFLKFRIGQEETYSVKEHKAKWIFIEMLSATMDDVEKVLLSDIKPSQFGEEYLNDSSKSEAEEYKKVLSGEYTASDVRKNNYYPILVNRKTMEILDGNHRHCALSLVGAKYAWVLFVDVPSTIKYAKGGGIKAEGDCFKSAYEVLIGMKKPDNEFIGTPYVIHAEVSGQGKLKGLRFGHAWVEDDFLVYDFSNNNKITIPKQLYYTIGDIKTDNPLKYVRYNAEQLMGKMDEHGTYGCWDIETKFEDGGAIQDTNKPIMDYFNSLPFTKISYISPKEMQLHSINREASYKFEEDNGMGDYDITYLTDLALISLAIMYGFKG